MTSGQIVWAPGAVLLAYSGGNLGVGRTGEELHWTWCQAEPLAQLTCLAIAYQLTCHVIVYQQCELYILKRKFANTYVLVTRHVFLKRENTPRGKATLSTELD